MTACTASSTLICILTTCPMTSSILQLGQNAHAAYRLCVQPTRDVKQCSQRAAQESTRAHDLARTSALRSRCLGGTGHLAARYVAAATQNPVRQLPFGSAAACSKDAAVSGSWSAPGLPTWQYLPQLKVTSSCDRQAQHESLAVPSVSQSCRQGTAWR